MRSNCSFSGSLQLQQDRLDVFSFLLGSLPPTGQEEPLGVTLGSRREFLICPPLGCLQQLIQLAIIRKVGGISQPSVGAYGNNPPKASAVQCRSVPSGPGQFTDEERYEPRTVPDDETALPQMSAAESVWQVLGLLANGRLTMAKTIFLIHGRHFKPPKNKLKALWLEALRWGIERDHSDKLGAFDDATKEFIYYGNYSNDFLLKALNTPYEDDSESRRTTLDELKNYKKSHFRKTIYERLPCVSKWREAAAWALGDILGALRLADFAIGQVAPDMKEYWNDGSQFGSDVRFPMIDPLREAMDRDDQILVISHSLGTMISYDTFWKFGRTGEYRRDYSKKKISLWITLGSPLADETVKRKLKGASISGPRRYPNNVVRWVNVAAEDDYISHDGVVANDYREMKEWKLIRSITDKRVYNLAVRDGKSNPHHGAGYLVHPYVANVVAKWL